MLCNKKEGRSQSQQSQYLFYNQETQQPNNSNPILATSSVGERAEANVMPMPIRDVHVYEDQVKERGQSQVCRPLKYWSAQVCQIPTDH